MQLMIGVQGTHGWTRRAAMALALCMIGCASPLPQQAPGEPRTPTPEPNAAAAEPGEAPRIPVRLRRLRGSRDAGRER